MLLVRVRKNLLQPTLMNSNWLPRKGAIRTMGTYGSDKPNLPGTCMVFSQKEKFYSGLSARKAKRTGMCKSPSTAICSILRWLSLKNEPIQYIAGHKVDTVVLEETGTRFAPRSQGTCINDGHSVKGLAGESRSTFHTQHAVTGR